jgi:hypothetical protein
MAADPLFDEMLTLHSGAIADNGLILVIALEQEKADLKLDHAHLLLWDGSEWRRVASLDYACVRARWIGDRWVVLGATGGVAIVSANGDTIETRAYPEAAPGKRGLMRSLAWTGQELVAVGMRHQVFVSKDASTWTEQTQAMQSWPALGNVNGFEGATGSAWGVYAVGWEGEIALRNDSGWQRIHSPTNLILTAVADCGDHVIAVGQRGSVLRGAGTEWTALELDNASADLWDVAHYAGRTYASSMYSLYSLEGNELSRVDMEDFEPLSSCYHLSVAGKLLCSVGPQAVGYFDGDRWFSVPMP